jgi:hypothetical protein
VSEQRDEDGEAIDGSFVATAGEAHGDSVDEMLSFHYLYCYTETIRRRGCEVHASES